MAKSEKSHGSKSTTFQNREIKAFLQLCRGLDKGEIIEVYRSMQFTAVRAKFQAMYDRLEREINFDL